MGKKIFYTVMGMVVLFSVAQKLGGDISMAKGTAKNSRVVVASLTSSANTKNLTNQKKDFLPNLDSKNNTTENIPVSGGFWNEWWWLILVIAYVIWFVFYGIEDEKPKKKK